MTQAGLHHHRRRWPASWLRRRRVCVRPMLRRVDDRQTGAEQVVPIPCGSTREAVCPPCARKARRAADAAVRRRLAPHRRTRHRPSRTRRRRSGPRTTTRTWTDDDERWSSGSGRPGGGRTCRTCRGCRWRTATVGRVFTAPDGTAYRPSMFLTLTLPLLRRRSLANGAPRQPGALRLPAGRAGCVALPEAGRPVLAEPAPLRRLQGAVLRRRRTPTPARPAPARRHPGRHPPRRSCGRSCRPPTTAVVAALRPARLRRPAARLGPASRLRRPRHRRGAADLGAGARPARRRPGRAAGARDAVRGAARHAGIIAPRARRPGGPVPDQVPDQVHRRHLRRRRPRPGVRGARRPAARRAALAALLAAAARTGCATASNPTTPAPAWSPAAAGRRPTTGRTSASAAAASWSPGSGPARPSPSTRPTGPPSSAKPSLSAGIDRTRGRPDGRHGHPAPTGRPGSCGPTPDPTPTPTPGSCSPRSPSGNAGAAQYEPPRHAAAGTSVGDSLSTVRPPSAPATLSQTAHARGETTPRPHPMTSPPLVAGAVVKGERSESAGREVPLTTGTETKQSKPGEAETPTTDHASRCRPITERTVIVKAT